MCRGGSRSWISRCDLADDDTARSDLAHNDTAASAASDPPDDLDDLECPDDDHAEASAAADDDRRPHDDDAEASIDEHAKHIGDGIAPESDGPARGADLSRQSPVSIPSECQRRLSLGWTAGQAERGIVAQRQRWTARRRRR